MLAGLNFNNTPYEFGVWNAKHEDPSKQYTFEIAKGQKEDLRWLL